MSTYCTVQDVKTALTPGAEVPHAGPDPAKLPDWQIIDAIEAAEGVVNSFVAARYQIILAEREVPAPTEENNDATTSAEVAPAPIRAWTRDIAAWYVTLTYNRAKDIKEDDPIRLRMGLVMGLLKDVRDRKSVLALPPVEDTNNLTSGAEIYNLYEGTLFAPEDFHLTHAHRDSQRFIRDARWGGNG